MHPQSSRLSNLAARRAASCLSVSALLTKEIEASANDPAMEVVHEKHAGRFLFICSIILHQ
jgi:hypothetical protein